MNTVYPAVLSSTAILETDSAPQHSHTRLTPKAAPASARTADSGICKVKLLGKRSQNGPQPDEALYMPNTHTNPEITRLTTLIVQHNTNQSFLSNVSCGV